MNLQEIINSHLKTNYTMKYFQNGNILVVMNPMLITDFLEMKRYIRRLDLPISQIIIKNEKA